MPASKDVQETRERQVYLAARRHYIDGETMETIARELGVSRPKVSRLLLRARETGVVRISLAEPPGSGSPTARRIAELFGINVHIANVSDKASATERLRAVAVEAAALLDALVTDGTSLGIAWGVTSAQVARELKPQAVSGVNVVQMNGATHAHDSSAPYIGSLLQAFATNYGNAHVIPFPVPTFFDHASTREAMWRERSIRNVLASIASLDVALFGVGYPHARIPSHVYAAGHVDPADLAEAIDQGAVGDVCTVLLRADGSHDGIRLNTRATGPSPDMVQSIAHRVCVVGDPSRTVALLAALRAGVVTDLVIDDVTARSLARMMQNPPHAAARRG